MKIILFLRLKQALGLAAGRAGVASDSPELNMRIAESYLNFDGKGKLSFAFMSSFSFSLLYVATNQYEATKYLLP